MGLLYYSKMFFPGLTNSSHVDFIFDDGVGEVAVAIVEVDRNVVMKLWRQDVV